MEAKKTEKYTTHSEKETSAVAEALAVSLLPGDVVLFSGGMGAGKTAFTRSLVAALGSRDDVSSPTFALVHSYRASVPIYHFDMYRITGFEDLYSTGFFDYLDIGAILVIEWSENVAEFMPEDAIRINIEIIGENDREITIEGGAAR